ncbi:MAG: porin [Alphaproteobacteria bacterium]
MKKSVLLGTTALVAAGMMAGDALAADPVSLSVGGYYRNAFVQILDEADGDGQGGDGFQDSFIKQDVEVHFLGETTLDNGLTVGVNIQLEAQTNADQIDETWAYISGSWGQLRVGVEDGVAYNFGYIGPYAGNFGQFTPYFTMTNIGNTAGFISPTGGSQYNTNFSVHNFYDGDSPRLYYTTPDFNGFQLGVSYAPDTTEDTNSPVVDSSIGGVSNLWDVAIGYSGEFSGVSVGLSGGYSHYHFDTTTIDPESWSVGANFGFGNWTLGGHYGEADGDTGGTLELEVWDVGLKYASGAWAVALGYSQGDWGAAGSGLQDDELSSLVLGVDYSMGPGISLGGAVSYNDLDNNAEFNGGAVLPDANDIAVGVSLTVDY